MRTIPASIARKTATNPFHWQKFVAARRRAMTDNVPTNAYAPRRMSRLLCPLFLLLRSLRLRGRTPARAGDYVGGSVAVKVCPIAAARSVVSASRAPRPIWRSQADGRYARGSAPAVGSALVFPPLRSAAGRPRRRGLAGDGAAEILVTQAQLVHHRVSEDQPVIDVSAANDWSVVRVWWPPVGQIGVSDYPAYGFISSTGRVTRPTDSGDPKSHSCGAERIAIPLPSIPAPSQGKQATSTTDAF